MKMKLIVPLLSIFLGACHGVSQTDHSGSVAAQGAQTWSDRSMEGQRHVVLHFDTDQYRLSLSDRHQLVAMSRWLVQHQRAHCRIEGNTDERGSREYNVALGERRAQSVADALRAMGVGNRQLTLVSYGEERPVALGHSPSDYRLNRRAEVWLQR